MSFTYDVFLSHTQADKPRVRRLAQSLKAFGFHVWFDEDVIQAGDDIYLAIERGLEASRCLVLCLSEAALTSDWVELERSTALFRDPTNTKRRFIPLKLTDCQLPDTLNHYKFVDYRQDEGAALERLIARLRSTQESGFTVWCPAKDDLIFGDPSMVPSNPKSFEDWSAIQGPPHFFTSLEWSPDGAILAAATNAGQIRLFNCGPNDREPIVVSEAGNQEPLYALAWNPQGTVLAAAGENVRFFDPHSGKRRADYPLYKWGRPFHSLAWSNDDAGEFLAAGDAKGDLHVWRPQKLGKVYYSENPHLNAIANIAWEPRGGGLSLSHCLPRLERGPLGSRCP